MEHLNKRRKMVVHAEAPTRVDLTGGFTDVPPLAGAAAALHVNAAIDLTVAAQVSRLSALPTQCGWHEARDIGLGDLVNAAGASSDVAVRLRSQAPLGIGLGASGALSVAIVAALREWDGDHDNSPCSIARAAVKAERASGVVGGHQDQCAAAFGSVRSYVVDDSICEVATHARAKQLEGQLLIVRAASSRRSSAIVAEVVDAYARGRRLTISAIGRLHGLAPEIRDAVGRGSAFELAALFREVIAAQLDLHPMIADPTLLEVAKIIESVDHAGAKFLGAGGRGGALLVVSPPGDHPAILQASARAGCSALTFAFSSAGVQVKTFDGEDR
jgi:galactokinase/mevalonate kinase-like predicted kinase